MSHNTDDLRIREIKELNPPAHVMREFACTKASDTVFAARQAMHRILHGMDDRMIVVIGPCSIHDTRAAIERQAPEARARPPERRPGNRHARVLREPRTTVGWKGLINDPELDGSFDINKGVRVARELLLDINTLGLPAGCEFLDMITPQYIADLVSWGAIGARTTESQVHRELASGLSSGRVQERHGRQCEDRRGRDQGRLAAASFPVGDQGGHSAIVSTAGNEDCHVILRGGKTLTTTRPASTPLPGHGQVRPGPAHHDRRQPRQQQQEPENQPLVAEDVARQMEAGDARLVGMMIESHLLGGRQDMVPGTPLVYGQSITDGCIDWDASVAVLERLALAVRERRRVATSGK